MSHLIFRPAVALLAFTVGVFSAFLLEPLRPASPTTQRAEVPVSISTMPVEFYAWCRAPRGDAAIEGVRGGVGDVEPNESFYDSEFNKPQYLRLDTRGAAFGPQPDYLDIVYRVENLGRRPVDLMILATGDLSVLPDRRAFDSDKVAMSQTILTERVNIGQSIIKQIAPGEIRAVKFSNFNLRAEVLKYSRKEYGALRPTALRVYLDLRTTCGQKIAQDEATLKLLPGQ